VGETQGSSSPAVGGNVGGEVGILPRSKALRPSSSGRRQTARRVKGEKGEVLVTGHGCGRGGKLRRVKASGGGRRRKPTSSRTRSTPGSAAGCNKPAIAMRRKPLKPGRTARTEPVRERHLLHPARSSLLTKATSPDGTQGDMSMEGIFGKPQERKSARAEVQRGCPDGSTERGEKPRQTACFERPSGGAIRRVGGL